MRREGKGLELEVPDVLPSDSRAIMGTHCVGDTNGVRYRLELLGLKTPKDNGVACRLRVFRSQDGVVWRSLSMGLNFRSRLRIGDGLFAAWPPENLDAVHLDCGLEILFHDEDVWESPVLPFDLDRESLWRATYVERSCNWNLSRVKLLRTTDDWARLPRILPSSPVGWKFED